MPPIPHKQSKKAQRRAAAAVQSRPVNQSRPRVRVAQDSLRWNPVSTNGVMGGLDDTGGMMMLEELDGVDVEWETGVGGSKTARFMAPAEQASQMKEQGGNAEDDDEAEYAEEGEWVPIADAENDADGMDVDGQDDQVDETEHAGEESEEAEESEEEQEEDEEFDDSKLPGWTSFTVRSEIKSKIAELGFKEPTEIQKQAVPLGLAGRDVVGVAETGSGKTLAYSLPIIQHLLSKPAPRPGKKRSLAALILCPTRELALQVAANISLFLPAPVLNANGSKQPPRISVASVVGGLSMQKQKRLVERGCDVLVATPGRLWDLMQMDDELAAQIRAIKFLVIDEADRMIETGHFAELENIVGLTQRSSNQAKNTNAAADDPTFQKTQTILDTVDARDDMQTFVFSATMSKDLQQNLKRKTAWKAGKSKGRKSTALEELVDKLDFRDEDPAVVDLSPEGGLVASLKESMIECLATDKDLYLYYFLLRYPGRSLVFVGSIDGIRRLIPLFEVLQVPVFPLHSQLQQKQRLKNLDRFKSSKNGILIATDVAARGLDIPSVDHVIHFNLPRTADAYIHRSGRTARAQNPGFALQLCAPEEKGVQRALMKSLGRTEDLPDLNIDFSFLPKMRERIRVARAIEKAQHHVKKDNHEKNWLRETAEAMDIDIDSDMLSDASVDPDTPYHVAKKGKGNNLGTRKTSGVALINLRNELKSLLAEPLMARGVSAKYPTSGSRVIVDELLKSANHPMMLGASTVKAYDEVQDSKPMRAKAPVRKVHVKKEEGHRQRKWEKEEAKEAKMANRDE